MLAELKLVLECPEIPKLNYNKASVLQGVIMQRINADYAEQMHQQGLKPYSQSIRCENEKNVWYVRTLSSDAYKQIIVPLLDSEFTEFHLEHNDVNVKIVHKELIQFPKSELIDKFYSEDADRFFTIDFLTPTAFKKNGKYHFFPDIYNIYSSLMNRYDATALYEQMVNEDTLEQLVDNTSIISYNLHSVSFGLEGVRIPAYIGNIVIKVNGPQTMANFVKLLFCFGDFAGVGIKTALGMGMIRVTEGKRR